VVAGCSSRSPTSTGTPLLGVWGSDAAGLAVTDTGGTLRILGFGTCYGSYADVSRSPSAPSFDLAGTFTQLTGAYPGKVEYAAEVTGSLSGYTLVVTVQVPALQQSFGPFALTRGVGNSWTACAYP
jgi:hypothetical protein